MEKWRNYFEFFIQLSCDKSMLADYLTLKNGFNNEIVYLKPMF